MANIEKLFVEKKYEEILEVTEGSKDLDELFMRVVTFVMLSRFDEAQECLNENSDILKEDLPRLMEIDILISYYLNDFEEAYKKWELYNEEPYFSQEMEEKLAYYKKDIHDHELKSFKNDKPIADTIIEYLSYDDISDNYAALRLLQEVEFESLDEIKRAYLIKSVLSALVNSKSQQVRSMCLIYLVDINYDKEVDFLSREGLIKINPTKIEKPYSSRQFNALIKRARDEKDSTFLDTFHVVLTLLMTYLYPTDFYEDDNNVYHTIRYYVLKMFQQTDLTLEQYCSTQACNLAAVKRILHLIDLADDYKN